MSILTNSFWLGDLSSFHTIMKLEDAIHARMEKALEAGQKFDMYSNYHDDDDDDEKEMEAEYQIIEGIAVIQVNGNLVSRETWITRMFGMPSYEGLRRQLNHAADNGEVNRIIMDFNTPGGSSEGVDEVGTLINKIDKEVKPVHGYTSGSANSAGYWLISACRDITCTKMASLGSIGVVTIHQEISKMLKERGIEVTVFRDGEMKAKPNMYEKLDQKTRDAVNNSLKILGNFFLDWVADQRGFDRSTVRAAVGEGRVFFGGEAVENGLADRIMFFDDFINKLKLLDSIGEPVTININQSFMSEEQTKQLVTQLNAMVDSRDSVILNLTNNEDIDMSAKKDNEEPGNTAGKTIKTDKGELTLEQAVAAIELGTLELTDDIKNQIATLKADLEADPESASEEPAENSEADLNSEASSDEDKSNTGEEAVLAHVQSQLTEQISTNTKLQLELETVKAKLSTQDDAVTALSQIAVNSCQKMGLIVGGSKLDYAAMDLTTLLSTHNSMAESFKAELHSGAVAAVELEKGGDNESTPYVAPRNVVTF